VSFIGRLMLVRPHSVTGQSSQALDEGCDRYALNRIQIYHSGQWDGVDVRLEHVDVRQLAPPQLTRCRQCHEDAAASLNAARSPHSSGSSIGLSYAA